MQTLDAPSTETVPSASAGVTGRLRAQLVDAAGRDRVARAMLVVAAALSFVLSVTLYFTGEEQAGIFVGIWVPSILALGALFVPRIPADRPGR